MLSVEEHLDCGLVGRAGCHGHDEPGSQCLLKLLWRRHIVQMDLHLMATSQGEIVKARVHSTAKGQSNNRLRPQATYIFGMAIHFFSKSPAVMEGFGLRSMEGGVCGTGALGISTCT